MSDKGAAPKIFGHTVFCDDIRTEADGKMSYIGSYPGNMIVQTEFPVTLPKFGFGIALLIRDDVAKKRRTDIPIRILLPGEDLERPSFSLEIPFAKMRDQAENARSIKPVNTEGDDNQYNQIFANLVVSPLTLSAVGRIYVRAIYGKEIIKLGSLGIQLTSSK